MTSPRARWSRGGAWALATVIVLLALSAQRPVATGATDPAAPPQVQAAPGSGVYAEPPVVTLTASAPSIIYYTADGSDPTTSPTRARYRAPLPIAGTTLLHFVAVTPVNRRSPIGSASYTIATTAGYRDQAYLAAARQPPRRKQANSGITTARGGASCTIRRRRKDSASRASTRRPSSGVTSAPTARPRSQSWRRRQPQIRRPRRRG